MGFPKASTPPSSDDQVAKSKKPKNKFAYACAIVASLNSILLGYDIAVMSGAAKFIQVDLKVDDTKIEILAGIINLYALIGAAAAGRTSDWIGRRYTMVLSAAIFFAGALLMGLAPNYAILMVGRFIAGVGVGYALMIAPVYTTELAPTSARGLLTSLPEVFINFGILVGYVSNFAFHSLPVHLNWRLMFCVGGIPPVFLAIAVLMMPESPRWLVMQGRIGDARRVLVKTSDSHEEAEVRLSEIKDAAGIAVDCNDDVVPAPKCSRGEGVWRELLIKPTPAVRRIVIAALGLQFFQQASGIDSVVLYSPRVFEKAGLKTSSQSLGATVSVGLSKTIFILVATFFVDRVGRRPLLLASGGGMVVSLLGLGLGLTVIEHNPDKNVTWAIALSITTILTFAAFFSIGFGPIAWVYCSEIFPLRLRAQGASMGVAMNRVMSGVISMTFLSLYKAITLGGSFFLYAGIAAVGWVFVYTFLPETRGKTLEEVAMVFGNKGADQKGEAGGRGGVELGDAAVKTDTRGGVTGSKD